MKKEFWTLILVLNIITGCNINSTKETLVETDDNGFALLTDKEVNTIVERSYPYVSMYNVNNKLAMKQDGWNTVNPDTITM